MKGVLAGLALFAVAGLLPPPVRADVMDVTSCNMDPSAALRELARYSWSMPLPRNPPGPGPFIDPSTLTIDTMAPLPSLDSYRVRCVSAFADGAVILTRKGPSPGWVIIYHVNPDGRVLDFFGAQNTAHYTAPL